VSIQLLTLISRVFSWACVSEAIRASLESGAQEAGGGVLTARQARREERREIVRLTRRELQPLAVLAVSWAVEVPASISDSRSRPFRD
jgi:hypothetical protein